MRKVFVIGIIAIAFASLAPKPAEAGGRGGSSVGALLAGVAIGAAIAYANRDRGYHRPPAYRPRPMPYPPAYHAGGYRPSPYALQYNPYTANRRYPGSYAQRRPCHVVYGVKRIGGIDHLVENQVCR